MGDIIYLPDQPTTLRDRRRFYLRTTPLESTGFTPALQGELRHALWFSASADWRPNLYVEDIDTLWCGNDQLGARLCALLTVWYEGWVFLGPGVLQ